MQFDRSQRIIDAILEKLEERRLLCPISGDKSDWEVDAAMSALPGLETFEDSPLDSTTSFPVAVLICKHCGYTMLMNLFKLGVAEELGLSVTEND